MTKIPLNPYFGNFRGFRCILFILQDQWYVGHFRYFEGYFGRFIGLEVYWLFQGFQGLFGNLEVSGCLWPFLRFWFYFGSFQRFRDIFVTLQVSGIFWSFFRFRGGILVIFRFQDYFCQFLGFEVYFGHFLSSMLF